MYDGSGRNWLFRVCDEGHLRGFGTLAQDLKTGRVAVEDVRRFQSGDWLEPVVLRRKSRLPGKGQVLPFSKGGPGLVAAHSMGAKMIFGVDVYEDK